MCKMPLCKECHADKDATAFEMTPSGNPRGLCKACRADKRTAATARAVKVDPESVPKPTACVKCTLGPDALVFKWRTDTMVGGWRQTCNACYN